MAGSLEGRFAFGENWSHFLDSVTERQRTQAAQRLRDSVGDLHGKTFLDVGCGSGIHSLAAWQLGASKVVGFDYDATSVRATCALQERIHTNWQVNQGSVLDESYLRSLGQFDVVYSWGVLHHTGDMWKALELVTIPARHTLVIAIYNDQGWQSRMWKRIKHRYVNSGSFGKKAIAAFTFCTIWGASLAYHTLKLRPWRVVSKWKNYARDNRGMSPWIDAVDWAGGYPFEVAKPEQIIEFYKQRGFHLSSSRLTKRNGCNEFVFHRIA